MSLVGNLEDLGLGEILQIVSLSRRSGVLSLESRGRQARVYFRNGKVIRAVSSSYQRNLGQTVAGLNQANYTQAQQGALADIANLAGRCDGVNLKLMKTGGLREALRMIHAAHAHGMKVMLGSMVESSLALSAAAQLAPLADYLDLDGHWLLAADPFAGAPLERGVIALSERPGLGVVRAQEGAGV